MTQVDASAAVLAFNEGINARDLSALASLMTEDHVFIDSAANAVRGKASCLTTWKGFFETFPDYRNVFDHMSAAGEVVVISGRSECSDARLSGPALWSARVRDGLIAEWRVYEDNTVNRSMLGI